MECLWEIAAEGIGWLEAAEVLSTGLLLEEGVMVEVLVEVLVCRGVLVLVTVSSEELEGKVNTDLVFSPITIAGADGGGSFTDRGGGCFTDRGGGCFTDGDLGLGLVDFGEVKGALERVMFWFVSTIAEGD